MKECDIILLEIKVPILEEFLKGRWRGCIMIILSIVKLFFSDTLLIILETPVWITQQLIRLFYLDETRLSRRIC